MKSITLIASTIVIALTLTAFTSSGWNVQPTHKMGCQAATEIEPPTFSYDLSPRANNTVTKFLVQPINWVHFKGQIINKFFAFND